MPPHQPGSLRKPRSGLQAPLLAPRGPVSSAPQPGLPPKFKECQACSQPCGGFCPSVPSLRSGPAAVSVTTALQPQACLLPAHPADPRAFARAARLPRVLLPWPSPTFFLSLLTWDLPGGTSRPGPPAAQPVLRSVSPQLSLSSKHRLLLLVTVCPGHQSVRPRPRTCPWRSLPHPGLSLGTQQTVTDHCHVQEPFPDVSCHCWSHDHTFISPSVKRVVPK